MNAQESGTSRTSGRNLVVCCDGTNNTLTGGIEDTNVLRFHGYLRKHAEPSNTVLYYDPGVGSPDSAPPTGLLDLISRRWNRIAGLASGQGVYHNIGEGYAFLMREWRPGDRIFCFGFSRGAFTARAIVGMVNLFGILRSEHEVMIPTLIHIYFSQPAWDEQVHGRKNWRRALARGFHTFLARPMTSASEGPQVSEEATAATRGELAAQVRRNFARDASVFWTGVWDTVESVGLPPFGSRDNPSTATFHDKPGMLNVRHALALDEHRWAFLPRLYDSPSNVVTSDGRTLKQLWFPGVHCDVGGSYADREPGSIYPAGRTRLADVAMIWMINEVASHLGIPPLTVLPPAGQARYDDFGVLHAHPFPGTLRLRHDALHDTPFWALAGMTVRDLKVHHVRTNAEAKRGAEGVTVDAKLAVPPPVEGPSVWDERRSIRYLAVAAILAVLAMAISGWNLLPDRRAGEWAPWSSSLYAGDGPLRAGLGAACSFAMEQLATISPTTVDITSIRPDCQPAPPGGLRRADVWGDLSGGAVAWAMLWDFAFMVAFGYVIARLASRVFAWAAGWRKPGLGRPPWLLAMGWLPAIAIGSDALENLCTLLALALRALAMPSVAQGALVVMGCFSFIKIVSYPLCLVVFGVGRAILALVPTDAVGKVGRRVGGPPRASASVDSAGPGP